MATFIITQIATGQEQVVLFDGTREQFIQTTFGEGGCNPAWGSVSEVIEGTVEVVPEVPKVAKKAKAALTDE